MTDRDLEAIRYRADEHGACNPDDVLRLVDEVRRLRTENAAINPCPVCRYVHGGLIDLKVSPFNGQTGIFQNHWGEWGDYLAPPSTILLGNGTVPMDDGTKPDEPVEHGGIIIPPPTTDGKTVEYMGRTFGVPVEPPATIDMSTVHDPNSFDPIIPAPDVTIEEK